MATAPDTVRSPGDVDDPDALERRHVLPNELGEVTVDETEDGQPTITVPISSTAPHRSDGKIMTEEALESMAEQLQTGEVGLWDDHGLSTLTGWREYRREDMYGKWVDGFVEDDVLWGTAELMDGRDATATLLDQLDQNMPVGFSVGYKPVEEEMLAVGEDSDEKRRHIFEVDLWETSPVGIPDNPNAIAAASALAAELDRADVELDAEGGDASTIATSVREALESNSMSNAPDDDSTEPAEASEAADAGTDPDPADGGKPPESRFTDSEVEEIMGIVGGVLETTLNDGLDEIESQLADSDEGGSDEGGSDEEEESVDVDVDLAGAASTSAGDAASAQDGASDVDELVERLDALEERNQDLAQRNEELEAKVERLESKTRESAGRKGISPAAGGDGPETDSTDAEPEESTTDHHDALAEARRLGGR